MNEDIQFVGMLNIEEVLDHGHMDTIFQTFGNMDFEKSQRKTKDGIAWLQNTELTIMMIHERRHSKHDENYYYIRSETRNFPLSFMGGGGGWSRNCFAHFSTHSFHCKFIMISMKKY